LDAPVRHNRNGLCHPSADIEAFVLGVWCIYCAASLGVITLMTVLVIGKVIADSTPRAR